MTSRLRAECYPEKLIQPTRILVRATNWVGDAVMSLPALRLIRQCFPVAHIAVQARPWVADLYAREKFCDEVILHTAGRGRKDIRGKLNLARELRKKNFDCAILLQNAFEAALIAWLAGIPARIGYSRDARRLLLTHAVPVPDKKDLPPHQSFYYVELLRRAGFIQRLPEEQAIRLEGAAEASAVGAKFLKDAGLSEPVIGVSPGAAYGSAKRWLPERFVEAAAKLANAWNASVSVFGSAGERLLCQGVVEDLLARGVPARNFAGDTSLRQFIDCAAACRVYLTNDSGAMHIASALGVPTVAVFGATDHTATGPTGQRSLVVREPVDCSPCLLRECPIDHRCMNRVPAERVVEAALSLVK